MKQAPVFLSQALADRDRAKIARPRPRIPLAVASGYGAVLVDVDGREMTDLTSGWNVVNAGWNHPRIREAVQRQAQIMSFAPPWCTHESRVAVAETLDEMLHDRLDGEWKSFCCTSGSEAVEAALKIARRATGRHHVVGVAHAYHGGTLGAMLASGMPQMHGIDLPIDGIHRYLPIPDQLRQSGADYAQMAEDIISSDPKPAAVLIEPVFTNPGVLWGEASYYAAIDRAAKRVGALLIIDEVGTGFGRTGKMFGFEHWPLRPDLIAVAKALTSGMVPMAATLMRADIAQAVVGPGFSSTFGWVPLACAAAEANLSVLHDEGLVERARQLGSDAVAQLSHSLKNVCPRIAAVRGMGMEIGIEFTQEDGTPVDRSFMQMLSDRLLARGVFAESSAYTTTLLIMPPLVIQEQQFRNALDIVCEEIIFLFSEAGAGISPTGGR